MKGAIKEGGPGAVAPFAPYNIHYCEHHAEWTPSRMVTIPNGHDIEWIQSRMSTYLVTKLFLRKLGKEFLQRRF